MNAGFVVGLIGGLLLAHAAPRRPSGFVSGLSPYRGGFTNIFPKEEGSMGAGVGMVMRIMREKRSKEEEEMESGSGFGSGYVEGGSGGEEQSRALSRPTTTSHRQRRRSGTTVTLLTRSRSWKQEYCISGLVGAYQSFAGMVDLKMHAADERICRRAPLKSS